MKKNGRSGQTEWSGVVVYLSLFKILCLFPSQRHLVLNKTK